MLNRPESKKDLEQCYEIPDKILSIDRSIRFCGIVDKLGHLVFQRYRKDAIPIMSCEDNARYALLATIRRRPTLPWKEKTGKTLYFVMRNENLIQATIPLSSTCLMLVYFDANAWNFEQILTKKILPMVAQEKNSNLR